MSQNQSSIRHIRYKIVMLGDQAVGKSSLVQKFVHDKFDQSANPTVAIDYVYKNVSYKGKNYRIQLWDTAGQQRYHSLIPIYLKDAHCAFIVYDVTSRASFKGVEKWLTIFKQCVGDNPAVFLVGNKIDITDRAVPRNEAEARAKELKVEYMEVSAKTGKRLQDLFNASIDLIEKRQHLEQTAEHQLPAGEEVIVGGEQDLTVQKGQVQKPKSAPQKLKKKSKEKSKCC